MKIIIVIITLVSLVVGYTLYKSNKLPDEINEFPTAINELPIKFDEGVISEEVAVQHDIALSEQYHNNYEKPITPKSEIISLDDSLTDNNTQELPETEVNEHSEMEKIALQEQELSDWAFEHKEWLYKMLQTKADAFSDKAFIKNFLEPGIEHLNDDDKRSFQNIGLYREVPILLQEPETDDIWANRTEKSIRHIIESQIQDNNFELYSVTCKQLTCEIIGAEHFPGSWSSFSLYLSGQLKDSIPTNAGWGRRVMDQNGVKYIYRILLFK